MFLINAQLEKLCSFVASRAKSSIPSSFTHSIYVALGLGDNKQSLPISSAIQPKSYPVREFRVLIKIINGGLWFLV